MLTPCLSPTLKENQKPSCCVCAPVLLPKLIIFQNICSSNYIKFFLYKVHITARYLQTLTLVWSSLNTHTYTYHQVVSTCTIFPEFKYTESHLPLKNAYLHLQKSHLKKKKKKDIVILSKRHRMTQYNVVQSFVDIHSHKTNQSINFQMVVIFLTETKK